MMHGGGRVQSELLFPLCPISALPVWQGKGNQRNLHAPFAPLYWLPVGDLRRVEPVRAAETRQTHCMWAMLLSVRCCKTTGRTQRTRPVPAYLGGLFLRPSPSAVAPALPHGAVGSWLQSISPKAPNAAGPGHGAPCSVRDPTGVKQGDGDVCWVIWCRRYPLQQPATPRVWGKTYQGGGAGGGD